MTIVVGVFVAVLASIVGSYYTFVLRLEDADQRALRKRLKQQAQTRASKILLVKEQERLSSLDMIDRLLGHGQRLVAPIQRLINQAEVRLTVSAFLLLTVCAAILPLLLVTAVTHRTILGVLVGACTAFIPLTCIRYLRRRRMWKFEEQFPEAIDLIARALRAGHTFPTGLSMVGEEMQAPIGTEFRLMYERQNFGMPMPEVLRDFADRTPVLDAKFFATAVLTQRDAGGNLAEVLDNLSSVIRERFKVKRQIRVLSAHGRITGWILAGLPPGLALVFSFVSPSQIRTLIEDPLGMKMIYAAIGLQVLGTLIMKKITNIEY